MLHFNLSTSFASISSFLLLQLYNYNYHHYKHHYHEKEDLNDDNRIHYQMINSLWNIIPFVYMVSLHWSYNTIMIYIKESSSLSSSSQQPNTKYYHDQQQHQNQKRKRKEEINEDTIDLKNWTLYYYIMVLSPFIIYVLSLPIKWNNSQLISTIIKNDDGNHNNTWFGIIIDIILVTTIPYYLMQYLHLYRLQWNIKHIMNTTTYLLLLITGGTITEILIHRYLIPLCLILTQYLHHHHFSHHQQNELLQEQNTPSTFSLSFLLNAIILLCFGYWLIRNNGRSRTILKQHEQELIINLDQIKMNDDNDDTRIPIMTLLFIIMSFCLGIILALPWYFIIYINVFGLGIELYFFTIKVSCNVSLCFAIIFFCRCSSNAYLFY